MPGTAMPRVMTMRMTTPILTHTMITATAIRIRPLQAPRPTRTAAVPSRPV